MGVARPRRLALFARPDHYVSEEIEPIYRIIVENGRLVLKRLKSEPEKLQPTLVDYFEGSNGDLHFQRDQSGNVSGFVLNSTGGIRPAWCRNAEKNEPTASGTTNKRLQHIDQ
jgi:hypothetical protein